MNFKEWILNEEIWPNDTATVYHRTKAMNIESILKKPFKHAEGCSYGCGLYTTFSIQSQFNSYMKTYGTTLCKFKVTKLDRFIICHLSLAKHILGDDYKISTQLQKLNLTSLYTTKQIEDFDKSMTSSDKSSVLAGKMYEKNELLDRKAAGIIYEGARDGYCLVKYEPIEDGTITLLGYAENVKTEDKQQMIELRDNCKRNEDGKCTNPWTTTTKKAAIKTLTNANPKQRLTLGDKISTLNPEIQKILDYPADKRSKWTKQLLSKTKIPTKQKLILLKNLPDVKEAIPLLFKNDELTSPLIAEILMNTSKTNTAINTIGIDNLEKLTGQDLAMAAYNYKQYKDVLIGNIIRKIIKKKKTISAEFLKGIKFLNSSEIHIDGEEIAYLLATKENMDMSPDTLGYLLSNFMPYLIEILYSKFDKKLFPQIPKQYAVELMQKGYSPKKIQYYLGNDKIKEFTTEDVKKILLPKYIEYYKDNYPEILKYFADYIKYMTPDELDEIRKNATIKNEKEIENIIKNNHEEK